MPIHPAKIVINSLSPQILATIDQSTSENTALKMESVKIEFKVIRLA